MDEHRAGYGYGSGTPGGSMPALAQPHRGRAFRYGLFLAGAIGLGALLLWAIAGLPTFGEYAGSYGEMLNLIGVEERRAANLVSSVTYDYRALDTLGEEFILLAAVTGVALLLRLTREERIGPLPARSEIDDALRFVGPAIVALMVLFGIYVATHGQLTPGGGFQGGAIVATGIMLLYLTAGYRNFRQIASRAVVEAVEAVGAGGFVVVGLMGLLVGTGFLQNFLPLGEFRRLLSGGTIPLTSLLVGCAVAGGFTSLYLEFLEVAVETPGIYPEEGSGRGGEGTVIGERVDVEDSNRRRSRTDRDEDER